MFYTGMRKGTWRAMICFFNVERAADSCEKKNDDMGHAVMIEATQATWNDSIVPNLLRNLKNFYGLWWVKQKNSCTHKKNSNWKQSLKIFWFSRINVKLFIKKKIEKILKDRWKKCSWTWKFKMHLKEQINISVKNK